MATLYDVQTQQPVDVPDEQVPAAFHTGRYALPPGSAVESADGSEIKPITSTEDALTAFKSGHRYLSPETAEGFRKSEEQNTVGKTAAAAAEGLLRGSTFGLSDLAQTKSGLVKPETLKDLRDYHPAASLGFEGAGMLATTLASGGAADALGIPAAASTGATLAKAAALGAAYNAGNTISEAALGDTELTAQKLLVAGGIGAALGLGGEGVLALGSRVLPPVFERAAATSEKLGELGRGLFSKASSIASGAPEELISEVAATPAKFAGATIDKDAVTYARLLQRHLDEVNGMIERVSGEARPEEVRSLLAGADAAAPKSAGDRLMIQMRQSIDAMRAQPEEFQHTQAIGRLEKTLTGLERNLDEAKTAADAHEALTAAKRQLDHLSGWNTNVTPHFKSTVDEIKTLRGAIRDTLEDPGVFGEAAAGREADYNSALSDLLDARKDLVQQYGKASKVKGQQVFEIKQSKVKSALSTLANGSAANEEKTAVLQNFVDASQRYMDEAKSSYEALPEAKRPDVDSLKDLFSKTLEERATPGVKMAQLRAYGAANPLSLGGRETIAAAAAHALGVSNPVVAAAGGAYKVLQALKNPAGTLETLARIQEASAGVSSAIRGAVNAFVDRADSLAGSAERATARSVTRQLQGDETKPASLTAAHELRLAGRRPTEESSAQAVARHTREIATLATDPDKLTDRIAKNTSRLAQAAPGVAAGLAAAASTSVMALHAKAPKDPNAGYGINAARRPFQPSGAELASYQRTLAVHKNPKSYLQDIKAGRVTREGTEAFKTIAPKVHQELVDALTDKLSKRRSELPYAAKVQLSTILGGTPIERSMTPEFISAMQQNFQRPQAQQPAPHARSHSTSKLHLAQNSMTSSQRPIFGGK